MYRRGPAGVHPPPVPSPHLLGCYVMIPPFLAMYIYMGLMDVLIGNTIRP